MSPADGRSVLITGCSTGIGRAVAHGLKTRGYRVFASARKAGDVEDLKHAGFEALRLDLDDPASVDEAVHTLFEHTGGTLYGLFNNGAYGQPGAVEDLSRDALRAQFESNLFGWHQLTCLVIPAMRRQGSGRIIQNSSVLGLVALKYRGAYNATKFALEGLSDTLRMELKGTGVHVSLIEPGPIKSRFGPNAYAAFKRYIDTETSVHKETYRAIEARLADEDYVSPFTLPAEDILPRVVHALESRRPKRRYYVTLPTYGFAVLRRVLPYSWMDRLLIAASRGENRR